MLGNIALTIGAILLILAVLAAIVIPILRVAEHKGKEAAQVKPDNSSQDIEGSDRTLAQARAEVDASARQKLNVQ